MRITSNLNNNSVNNNKNIRFGMFKTDCPQTVEKLNRIFHATRNIAFKLTQENIAEQIGEASIKDFDMFVKKHPDTYFTLNDTYTLSYSSNKLADIEKLAKSAKKIPRDILEETVNTHFTEVSEYGKKLTEAQISAGKEISSTTTVTQNDLQDLVTSHKTEIFEFFAKLTKARERAGNALLAIGVKL